MTVGPSPDSIPITPKITPKGTTGIRSGMTSRHPFEKILKQIFISGELRVFKLSLPVLSVNNTIVQLFTLSLNNGLSYI